MFCYHLCHLLGFSKCLSQSSWLCMTSSTFNVTQHSWPLPMLLDVPPILSNIPQYVLNVFLTPPIITQKNHNILLHFPIRGCPPLSSLWHCLASTPCLFGVVWCFWRCSWSPYCHLRRKSQHPWRFFDVAQWLLHFTSVT